VDVKLQAKDLAEILAISKSYVSEILNYKKSFSKDVIRKLSQRFKISHEAFNKPYLLKKEEPKSRRQSEKAVKQKRKVLYV
jgi:HTH-type transcriptional regulator/antitoxin HigA